ncbi:MAG: DsbA family protein [Oceanospirillales bacterium]|nr:DsbA family protein [Oceanospirillales bacterium]
MRVSLLAGVVGLVSALCLGTVSAAEPDGAAIDKLIDQKIQEYVESDAFQQRIEAGIVEFINKQNQARVEQERKAREEKVKNIAPVDPANEYVRGPVDAPYTLIEYSDYECPYCKRFHATVLEFVKRNPDVNWVYRHFPLDFHNPGAQKQAEAAECAGSLGCGDAFWHYSDLIFERTKSNGKGFPIANLVPLAGEIGLDESAFKNCLDSEQFKSKVLQQQANGMQAGVTGTPGSFLRHNSSGEVVPLGGARPLRALEGVIQQMRDAVK